CDQLAGHRIQQAIDSQAEWTEHNVEGREISALMFGERDRRILKAEAACAPFVVEWKAEVIDRIRTRSAFHVVLIGTPRPVPAKIELGERRSAAQHDHDDDGYHFQWFHHFDFFASGFSRTFAVRLKADTTTDFS